MKALKFLTPILSLGFLLFIASCGSSPSPPESIPDQQLGKLSKTWKIKTVTLDGNAVTNPPYTGFQLTITGTKGNTSFGYTTTGRPTLSAWKASGTWAFGADPVTMITRDPDNIADKLDMTYAIDAAGQNLQISFNYQGNGFTRTDAVKGNWVFTFTL